MTHKVRWWQRRRFFRMARMLCWERKDEHNAMPGYRNQRSACGVCVDAVLEWW